MSLFKKELVISEIRWARCFEGIPLDMILV